MKRRELALSCLTVGFSGILAGCVNSDEDGTQTNNTKEKERSKEKEDQSYECENIHYNTEELALRHVEPAYGNVNRIPLKLGVTYGPAPFTKIKLINESGDGEETLLYPLQSGGVWHMMRGNYFEAITEFRDAQNTIDSAWDMYSDSNEFLANCDPNRADLLEQAVDVGKQRLEYFDEATTQFYSAAKAYIDAGLHEVEFTDENGETLYKSSVGLRYSEFEASWAPEANSHFNRGVRNAISSYEKQSEYPTNMRNKMFIHDPESDN